jgi:hypothetical protein
MWLRPTSDVDIRGIRAIHGTVVRNPGNVETRDILVGVTVSMCTVMEVKDTSLSEISGESGMFCTVVMASAEFALFPRVFVQP